MDMKRRAARAAGGTDKLLVGDGSVSDDAVSLARRTPTDEFVGVWRQPIGTRTNSRRSNRQTGSAVLSKPDVNARRRGLSVPPLSRAPGAFAPLGYALLQMLAKDNAVWKIL